MTKGLGFQNRATLYIALKIVGAGIGFLNTIFIARLLGPKEYGVMSLALAGANLLATVAALGLPYWITREIAVLRQDARLRKLVNVSSKGLRLCLMVSILPAIFAMGAYGYFREWSPSKLTSLGSLAVISLAVLFIPMAAINQIRAGIIRGLGRALTADFPDIIIRPLSISVAVCAAIALIPRGDAALGMTIQVCGAAASFIIGSILLWRCVSEVINDGGGIGVAGPQDEVHMRDLLREAPHFLLILLLATMDGQLSIYLVGLFSGPGNVGIFQVALQPLNIILMGLTSVGVYAQPRIAAAWAMSQKSRAQAVVNQATKFSSQVAISFGMALILLATPIIRLYGSTYEDSAALLRILAIGQIVHGVTGPIGVVMLMTGNQKKIFYFDAMFLALKVVMLGVGIHYFGLVGAAISEVVYLLIMRLTGVIFVYKHTGLVTTLWGRQRILD